MICHRIIIFLKYAIYYQSLLTNFYSYRNLFVEILYPSNYIIMQMGYILYY